MVYTLSLSLSRKNCANSLVFNKKNENNLKYFSTYKFVPPPIPPINVGGIKSPHIYGGARGGNDDVYNEPQIQKVWMVWGSIPVTNSKSLRDCSTQTLRAWSEWNSVPVTNIKSLRDCDTQSRRNSIFVTPHHHPAYRRYATKSRREPIFVTDNPTSASQPHRDCRVWGTIPVTNIKSLRDCDAKCRRHYIFVIDNPTPAPQCRRHSIFVTQTTPHTPTLHSLKRNKHTNPLPTKTKNQNKIQRSLS